MQLKRLELLGFKSFVERTIFDFGPGVTSIIGPNGCGKSNCVDAIRWVMGEQSAKHLRGGAMEDVIFSGSSKRAPLGLAEVFLTLDNNKGMSPAEYADCKEIQIGRRLYRSGESEYFINKHPVRLKDVHNFFLGTGVGTKAYSIVEQGMIGSIITARPEDKRKIIEEAAGISKFKIRRDAAQRRMESTKANLLRLNDIIAEIEKQVRSLDRQAKKAKKYQEFKVELEKRELTLLSTKYSKLAKNYKTEDEQKNSQSEQEAIERANLSSKEANLDQLRLELVEQEQHLETIQRDLYSAQSSLRLNEAEIGHLQRERDELKNNRRLWEEEAGELTERLKDLKTNIQNVNNEKVDSDCVLVEMNTRLVAAENKLNELSINEESESKKLNDIRQNLQNSSEEKTRITTRIEGHLSQQEEAEIKINQLREQKNELEKQRLVLETELADKKCKLANTQELSNQLIKDEEASSAEVAEKKKTLTEIEEKLADTRKRLQEKTSKLEALEELETSRENFPNGIKALLNKSKDSAELKGVVGTISDLVEVEPGYETATSAVLGDRLQYVVVESRQHGMQAVEFLNTIAEGRGTFVPTEVLPKTIEKYPEGNGVIGKLGNYVRFPSSYEKVHNYLLNDVVIVENLETAIDKWSENRCTYVTPIGEVVDSHGVISGGKGGCEIQYLSQKNRIKELKSQIEDFETVEASQTEEANNAQKSLSDIEERLEQLKKQSQDEQMKKISNEKDWQKILSDIESCTKQEEQLIKSISEIEQSKMVRQQEIVGGHGKIEDLQRKTSELSNQIRFFEENALNARVEKKQADDTTMEIRIKQAEAKAKAESALRHAEELAKSRATAYLELERRKSLLSFSERRLIAIDDEQERTKLSLDNSVKKAARLEEEQREIRTKYEDSAGNVRKLDASLREVRNKLQELVKELHQYELDLSEQRSELDHIKEKVQEYYHKDLTSIYEQYVQDDLNQKEEEVAVSELKAKLEKLGGVDTEALSERESLHERLGFLKKQHEDLVSSLEALEKAIKRINVTSRERFEQTFKAVDNEFQKLFPRLFRGGQAKLLLGEGDVLEAGVDILVQPPGKRLQSMTLLSGGEKALTAVSLVFAIFLVKPSPFCLLDEVDAPLDDVNIDRFNKLVRSMTTRSQFVIITHNKRTMELADVLYGVTMAEPGVSRIVTATLEK